MKLNQDVIVDGEKLILVPYLKEHVPRYHQWMSDPILRELTASDELTLEEEYENQISWRGDEHKLTFIILDRSLVASDFPEEAKDVKTGSVMCGDCNLFFHSYDNDDEEENQTSEKNEYSVGEIEIMIAEEKSRSKGIAKEAIQLMIQYAKDNLHTRKFIAKIGEENVGSRSLFTKLGFVQIGEANYFKEVTLEFNS